MNRVSTCTTLPFAYALAALSLAHDVRECTGTVQSGYTVG